MSAATRARIRTAAGIVATGFVGVLGAALAFGTGWLLAGALT